MRKNTQDRTQDQIIFDIMETKYKISNILTSIIQESSVDCIQNSRDDIQLNNKCLKFLKFAKMRAFDKYTFHQQSKYDK